MHTRDNIHKHSTVPADPCRVFWHSRFFSHPLFCNGGVFIQFDWFLVFIIAYYPLKVK